MTNAQSFNSLEADYLIVGAGAMGMAFADVLLAESDATIIMIDRHDKPGGHWNDAYPFVRLHTPSAYYGVNSRPLGENRIDQVGENKGFFERASAAEICGYYDQVMEKQFLPTGRLQYFPMCDYVGNNTFVSLVSGKEHRVTVRKKIVDATYSDTAVPSRTPPKYDIAPGIRVIPPNALPQMSRDYEHYVVVGAGKTGIDTCLWLLDRGVPAERIQWIMPRDPWLLDRAHMQPGDEFFESRVGSIALQLELICKAQSIDHLFALLAETGQLLRIDESVQPTSFRCASVSRMEIAALRRIKNVIRHGRVKRIEADRIVMTRGTIPTSTSHLHIDCTASGVRFREAVPVFNGNLVTLQAVRICQPCFSAALIGHVEAAYNDEAEKNQLCMPVPYAVEPNDWLRMNLANLRNQYVRSRDKALRAWLANTRLDINHGRGRAPTPERAAIEQRFRNSAGPATAKLRELLTEVRSAAA